MEVNMNYKVLDRCRIQSYDMNIYNFIKNNFESDAIKVALIADVNEESFGYFIEIRKVENK